MGVKLYYGGYGDYKVFAVAENNEGAVKRIGEIINAPFLPVTAEEISEVDGYCVSAQNGTADDKAQITGETSDGYHTFNELYHHRAVLFSVICNEHPDKAWKSLKHDTGDMYDGMFIVGIETPDGQATYHYDINPYWDMFKVKELPNAPKWDGHTPSDAISRIGKLGCDRSLETRKFKCKQCGAEFDTLAELGRHSKQEHPKKGA